MEQVARRYGTPLYVYSSEHILERLALFEQAFSVVPHLVCYAVKANSTLAILKMLAQKGCGFDVVSGGELERVLAVDRAAAERVVFSGVGKTASEMDLALRAGILVFNVEGEEELELLAERAAKLRGKARFALRVNPDVFAETHPYISTGMREHKFGIDIRRARAVYRKGGKYLEPAGVSVHIGSQIRSADPFGAAAERVVRLIADLRQDGHAIRYADLGGGLGVEYHPDKAFVLYVKKNGAKTFVITDAAMNDLIRPALYQAYHEIVPVQKPRSARKTIVDVVGPVCETGDFLARDRELPTLRQGDLVAILDAGAYGMSLASNYNTRPRPAEVLVRGRRAQLIRRRESMHDMLQTERNGSPF